MIERFGPWSSSLGDVHSPHLSTFWRRRLTRLPEARGARNTLSRRDWLKLGSAGVLAAALPTFRLASADDPVPAKAPEDAKIYVYAIPKSAKGFDDANKGIYVIEPRGAVWRKLREFDGNSRVSRDGKRLALVRAGKMSGGVDIPNVGVWTLSADGEGQMERVCNFGGVVSWSPDSKQLIITKWLGKPEDDRMLHEAWRFNADGTGATKLPIPETEEVDDWSSDGRWLVTVSDRHEPHGRGYQLYVMHPDGTEQRRLTEGRGLNVYPRFSPDGRRIVYLHQERGVNSLWIVNIDGTGRRMLMQEENNVMPDHVCWAPDGKSLAYVTELWQVDEKGKKTHDPAKSLAELWIIDDDGKNARQLPLPPMAWISQPDWR